MHPYMHTVHIGLFHIRTSYIVKYIPSDIYTSLTHTTHRLYTYRGGLMHTPLIYEQMVKHIPYIYMSLSHTYSVRRAVTLGKSLNFTGPPSLHS